MQYNIRFNMRKIKKINKPFKMQQEGVLTYVDIDPELLREKDSWYIVDSKVSFYKPRHDVRVAGECISVAYAQALGNETANYSVVNLDDKIGLLSPNFQDTHRYSYYDFCQLYKLFPSYPNKYNHFTLKELLQTFAYHYDDETCATLQQMLISRYLYEWFTHQLDGNPRNTNLRQDKDTKVLDLGPVFDKEQSFGVNEHGLFDEEKLEIWVPSIPYEDIDFRTKPYQIDGIDANVFSLLIDYPDVAVAALEHLFTVDYDAILDTFVSGESSFSLPAETRSYLKGIVEKKAYEKEKILKIV